MPLHSTSAFTTDEYDRIQGKLNEKLDKDDISYRPSAAGNVAYIEGWRTFNLANQVFGFNGWSSEILQLSQDFCEVDAGGKISLGMSCMVRVYLKDGTFHDDIGYGSSEGQRSKGSAYEKAKKEAVTDAMKRALRVFGNRLGNCAYDKVFLRDVKNGTLPKAMIASENVAVNNNNTINTSSATNNGSANSNSNHSRPPPIHHNMTHAGIPAGYKPAWQPARSALSHATSLPAHHASATPASDDYDALITEADLYDLEMS